MKHRLRYEPSNLRLGQTIIAPELTVGQTYDSNIFADSSDEADFITIGRANHSKHDQQWQAHPRYYDFCNL